MLNWFTRLFPRLATLVLVPVLAVAVAAQTPAPKLIGEDVHTPQLPEKDAVRILEFYRLAPQIADDVWPGWSHTIAPLFW